MFTKFFFNLKARGVPISLPEWILLHEALAMNINDCSLTRFYHVARSVLVKNEVFFDRYDLAFLDTFEGIETSDELLEQIIASLKKVKELNLSEEEKKQMDELNLDEVIRNFERQLHEQWKEGFTEHVGGNRAIGTGGRSTQGAWGYNHAGVRIGQGVSRHKRAVQIAEKRTFKNYSNTVTLDTRQMRVALSHLRSLLTVNDSDQLDVDATIDRTCQNAGEIEFVWQNKEKKSSKVVLFMDIGGSMTPHTQLVERLFSAASSQFTRFKTFYFHNCVYQDLWLNMERNDSTSTAEFLKNADDDYKAIIVGDAEMAPSELTWVNGAVDYWYRNDIPGMIWLQRLKDKFKDIIWLNPLPSRTWNQISSIRMVRQLFPMFELTIEGLDEGVQFLVSGKCSLYAKL